MPKYYVESGPVQLVFDAPSATTAAVMAFQWTCDKQAKMQAASPIEHVREAERRGWQLQQEIRVNQRGFGRGDGQVFDTLQIVKRWEQYAVPAAGTAI